MMALQQCQLKYEEENNSCTSGATVPGDVGENRAEPDLLAVRFLMVKIIRKSIVKTVLFLLFLTIGINFLFFKKRIWYIYKVN